jgi:hypothetical protein
MITSPILEEKWRVQNELSKQVDHDPSRYIALAHQRAVKAQERYGIQFRYTESAKPDKALREEPDFSPDVV